MNLLIIKKVAAFVVFTSAGTTTITLPFLDWNVQETQDLNSDYVYFYVRGNPIAPKPLNENINHDKKNYVCKFNIDPSFNCEITTVKSNFQKQHKVGKIVSSHNKPGRKELMNRENIFQIKFSGSLWKSIREDKTRFIDIAHKTTNAKSIKEYAYLEPLFATYKNEIKGFFNAFIVELTNIDSQVVKNDYYNQYSDYSYSFTDRDKPNGSEIVCKLNTLLTKIEDKNSKTNRSWQIPWKFHYKNLKAWSEKEFYLISLGSTNAISNFRQEQLYVFQNYTKGKLTFNISEPVLYDHYSEHMFIF